jgi:Ferric reductase like transmembrane component
MAPIREGGFLELRELLKDKRRELSGIVLEFTFTCLVAFSIPWVRNRFYEAFKALHIVLAVLFFVFLFWHIKGEATVVSIILSDLQF